MTNKNDIKKYIESGDYFKDAMKWYETKYLLPINQRVWFFYTALLLALMLVALIVNINRLLPIRMELNYTISSANESNAQVIRMDASSGITPHRFIAENLLKNYVMNRESYDHSILSKQFDNVQNSSTRMVFKRFYNYMSINNPDSPLMRYQKYARRYITITNLRFVSDNNAIISFSSISKDNGNNIFENLNWEATIGFEMGNVGMRLATGERFDFTVTDYKLKLLGENK